MKIETIAAARQDNDLMEVGQVAVFRSEKHAKLKAKLEEITKVQGIAKLNLLDKMSLVSAAFEIAESWQTNGCKDLPLIRKHTDGRFYMDEYIFSVYPVGGVGIMKEEKELAETVPIITADILDKSQTSGDLTFAYDLDCDMPNASWRIEATRQNVAKIYYCTVYLWAATVKKS